MKTLSVPCVALCVGLSTTAAFARGGGMGGAHGMGSSHMSMMGGAFGTTAAAPGTNSSGTALSSDGVGHPMAGTNSVIDPEDAKIDKTINSICRGC
jgi:hypothetical protein